MITFLISRLLKRRKKRKRSTRQLREVPVVRRTYLADGSWVTDLITHSKPGEKTLQFPYEIPTINTSVSLAPDVQQTLITVSSIVGVSMIASAALKRKASK
jgi:hypothetical protein